MSDEAIEALTSLGLSLGEAKTYIALATVETSEATPLAEIADVPQPRVYAYLEGLETKGLVVRTKIDGKPNRYRAEDPEVVFTQLQAKLQSNIDQAKKFISKQKTLNQPDPSYDAVNVIQRDQSIRNRIHSIANNVTNNVYIFNHQYYNPMIDRIFTDLDVKVVKPIKLLGNNPFIQTLLNSSVANVFQEKQLMIMIADVDLETKSCDSISIIAYGEDELIKPVMIQIFHPVILELQMSVISELIHQLTKDSGSLSI